MRISIWVHCNNLSRFLGILKSLQKDEILSDGDSSHLKSITKFKHLRITEVASLAEKTEYSHMMIDMELFTKLDDIAEIL